MKRPVRVWPQDIIEAPISYRSARVDPVLAQLKREPLIYTMDFSWDQLDPARNGPRVMAFEVDLSNVWFLSNISAIAFDEETDVIMDPVGFLTLRSNSDQYAPFEGFPLATVASLPDQQFRSILPMPWGVGAGGSFIATITFDQSLDHESGFSQQITFEGWRWFDFGGGAG